jgi:hypothetical protein
LGEFSLNGSLLSLDSYLKIDEDSYIFGYFNPTFKAMYYFCPKTYWATLWAFYHKLVRSPWMCGSTSDGQGLQKSTPCRKKEVVRRLIVLF